MAWNGAILGGILGATFGGPIGAAIGAGIGSLFGNEKGNNSNNSKDEEDDKVVLYYFMIFTVVGKFCKIDGIVSKEEVEVIKEYYKKVFNFDLETQEYMNEVMTLSKDISNDEFMNIINELSKLIDNEAKISLAIFLIDLAIADGSVSKNEYSLLMLIEKAFRFPDKYIDSLLNQRFKTENKEYVNEADLENSYKILGVNENSSKEEITKAYKKKALEYHPDKISSKGLPDDFVKFAAIKFNEIHTSYETIKKCRNF